MTGKRLRMPVLYLASQSRRRQDLLRRMGVPFRVVPSAYRERMLRQLGPSDLVLRHAEAKARRARLPRRARWVLGADTIVWHRGRALGKPRRPAEARAMIRSLAGRSHRVFTGLFLWDRRLDRGVGRCAVTRVTFRKLTESEIRNYLEKVNPFDKAGSYAIQEGPRIVRQYEGSYTNVIGLPVELLRAMLRTFMFPAKPRRNSRSVPRAPARSGSD